MSLFGLKKYQSAREENVKILTLKPGDMHALSGMGLCFLREGEVDSATFYFRKAIEADSSIEGLYNDWLKKYGTDLSPSERDSFLNILEYRFSED
jgi:hypothetical protein